MALQKTVKCPYHGDEPLASFHPEYIAYPFLCPWCQGKLEYDKDVYLPEYKGKFIAAWRKDLIHDYQDDIYVHFTCTCGDEITLSEDPIVCNCGRIYRLSMNVEVDETHIGEQEFLIEESNRK